MNPIGLWVAILIGLAAEATSDRAPTYSYVGCYRDEGGNRVLPNHQAGAHGNQQCFELATHKGLKFYGLQNGGECWLDETNKNDYDKHGVSGNCIGREGGPWANSVYKVNYPCFNIWPDIVCYPSKWLPKLACNVPHVKQNCQKACKDCK